jgi:hypothetical protein
MAQRQRARGRGYARGGSPLTRTDLLLATSSRQPNAVHNPAAPPTSDGHLSSYRGVSPGYWIEPVERENPDRFVLSPILEVEQTPESIHLQRGAERALKQWEGENRTRVP